MSNVIFACLTQTNGANHSAFVEWSKSWPDVKLVSDGAMSNEVWANASLCCQVIHDGV